MKMDIKQVVKKVEDSKAFKDFIKQNSDYYLVHCFAMIGKDKNQAWEIGYYSEKKDDIVVFEADKDIKMRAPEEAFKKEGVVNKLDMSRVKTSLGNALDKCNEILKKNYPGQMITKKIIILQNLEEQVFNITLVSASFNIINIRIDAASGGVLKHNMQSIMSLRKE